MDGKIAVAKCTTNHKFDRFDYSEMRVFQIKMKETKNKKMRHVAEKNKKNK